MSNKPDLNETPGPGRPARAPCGHDEQFHLLVVSVEDHAIIILDTDCRVSDWNLGAQHVTGHTEKEILGQPLSVFYTDEDVSLGLPSDHAHKACAIGRHESDGWRVKRDGSWYLAHTVLTALRNPCGGLRGYALLLQNVSARAQLEERFKRVVDAAPSAMIMINDAGSISMVNLQAERMFGYSCSELLGQSVEMLVPERFRDHHPGMRRAFFNDPKSRPVGAGRDLYALRKDGSEFAVEIGLNPIETEDGPMVLSAVVDITDRKNKEERTKAALLEKDILLREIHHRVKNNLQIIHSLLDLQASRIEDSVILEMLQETQNRIQSMALIHQTLYQSQDFSSVDFRNFLDNLLSMLSASHGLDSGHIRLSIDSADVLLPLNVAIPCGLIVNEIVTNSLRHAFPDDRPGEISVTLAWTSDNQVQLIASDDGVGIPDTFDLDNTGSLGMRLIYLLSEQIDGVLSISRAHPTRFTIRFQVGA
jgi:PAS domain S-box-containing protein